MYINIIINILKKTKIMAEVMEKTMHEEVPNGKINAALTTGKPL